MKVCELEGRELDAAVARALGWTQVPNAMINGSDTGPTWWPPDYGDPLNPLPGAQAREVPPRFSAAWADGGPIIDAHPITIERGDFRPHGPCKAWVRVQGVFSFSYGETPLIAAMRCYVASVFGETLPDGGILPSQ